MYRRREKFNGTVANKDGGFVSTRVKHLASTGLASKLRHA